MTLPLTSHYRELFLRDVPLLDVRAPVEFAQGAFPNAYNLPLLTDVERHDVGLRYTEQGQPAAIELGHALVAGETREARLQGWLQWCERHPDGQLYCFRGGMRSGLVQEWLAEAGHPIPRIRGGYKAMRRFLLGRLEETATTLPLVLLSGRTGTGKTRVIEELDHAVDLEGLARHRGSAFGRRPGGQPTQIDFENALAIRLLRLQARQETAGPTPVVLEDESKLVGHRLIPPALHKRMKAAPRVFIEEPLASRVQVTLEDYVLQPLLEYAGYHGAEQALDRLGAELLASLDRIRNRLGGARHRELRAMMESALNTQARTGSAAGHQGWIEALLAEYYDPLYDHALRRQGDIGSPLFVGTRAEVLVFLRALPEGPAPAPGRVL
ncbi:MAG: tRNA 2-selenouridine(34) synthase MnmH [Thioalkalivibrio sp.]|nr:MAG: tRNA 2-selenouridine(34) synthase MnmH [Thioalkalivibrio sp.]